MRWIDIKKKLPAVGEQVLISGIKGGYAVGSLVEGSNEFFNVPGKGAVRAMYWLPLPRLEAKR